MFRSLIKIWNQEGIKALFSGLTASAVGTTHAFIYFPMYEKMKIYYKKNYEPEES